MRVLILGADSPLIDRIAREAAEESHGVTLFAGDILRIGEIDPPMAFQQAVICSLDALSSEGTDNLIRAMRRHNVRRLICVGAVGGDAEVEELVRKCDRDWLVVRHATLTGGSPRARFDVLLRSSGASAMPMALADASGFIVAQLKSGRYLYKCAILTD